MCDIIKLFQIILKHPRQCLSLVIVSCDTTWKCTSLIPQTADYYTHMLFPPNILVTTTIWLKLYPFLFISPSLPSLKTRSVNCSLCVSFDDHERHRRLAFETRPLRGQHQIYHTQQERVNWTGKAIFMDTNWPPTDQRESSPHVLQFKHPLNFYPSIANHMVISLFRSRLYWIETDYAELLFNYEISWLSLRPVSEQLFVLMTSSACWSDQHCIRKPAFHSIRNNERDDLWFLSSLKENNWCILSTHVH